MFSTPLGYLSISVDGHAIQISPSLLPVKTDLFVVDGRYGFSLTLPRQEQNSVIEALFSNFEESGWECGVESGERLALISFNKKDTKVSLGTEGDIAGIEYEYLPFGIRLVISPECSRRMFRFIVAWITTDNMERDEIFTWFAADPMFINRRGDGLRDTGTVRDR